MTARLLGLSEEVAYFDELHFVDELVPAEELSAPLEPHRQSSAWHQLSRRWEVGILQARRPRSGDKPLTVIDPEMPNKRTGAQLLIDFMASKAPGGVRYVCEQTPRNVNHIGVFLSALPETKVVSVIRDPRDVLLSQRNRWRRRKLGSDQHTTAELVRNWVNYQPVLLAVMWRRATKKILEASQDERVIIVRFEDLVKYPTESLARLCGHLAIEANPRMLDVPHMGSSSTSDQRAESGIRTDATGRWRTRLSRREVWVTEVICGDLMHQQGYPTVGVKPNIMDLIRLSFESLTRLIFVVPMNRAVILPNLKRLFLPSRQGS